MEPVAAILGSWAISKVADTVWTAAGSQVQDWLNKTDIEKAIEAAKQAVDQWERDLPPQKHLFFFCEQNPAHRFLDRAFTTTSVQEELLRPLQHEGQPDLRVLLDAFSQVAGELRVKLNQPYLEPWLKQFTDAYFAQTSAFRRYQLAKQRYFEQLQTLCDDVKLLGVAVEGREAEKQKALAQIFVMPNVEEIRSGGSIEAFWAEERPDERQSGLLQEQRQWALRERSRRLSARQLLGQSTKRIVILGAPGSGKTTLLNYFGVKLAVGKAAELQMPEADWLPILIRIRDWVEHPDRSLLEQAYGFCDRLAVGKLPEGFFEYWLDSGRAVILLDGLDEVADETRRSRIAEEIELFLQRYSQNPALITSRPAGYRSYFRSETFPHYELQPFDERQIEEFINNWYDSRTLDRQEAEQGKASLRRALKDSPRIKLLTKNPLLLTIVALIHRYEAYLPKQRHELYERAVKTLLTSWERGKYSSNEANTWDLQYLKHDDLLLLMRQLAYWIHTQGSTGDSEGGTLIDKDELIRQLSRLIKTQKQIELHYAQQEAERLVNFIRSRTGLLNEQGQDCYAFVHKTFQEYLTAEEIQYRHECEDDFEIVLSHIEEHLHDPHWREVLLLLVSRQVGKRAAKAIRRVLTHGSEYEQWLHRDLLFAAKCLAENCKNLKTVEPALATEILDQLIELEIGDEKRIGREVRAKLQHIFCSFRDTEFQAQTLDVLKRQNNIEEARLRDYRAALGEEALVIQMLLTELEDEDSSVRGKAAGVLGQLGNASKLVLQALLKVILDEDSLAHLNAIFALRQLGKTSEPVLHALLRAVQNREPSVRSRAASALGNLRNVSEPVIQTLLKAVQDEDSVVRWSAADALRKLGNVSQLVLQVLLKAIQDEDLSIRRRTVAALEQLTSASEPALQALLNAIQDKDSGVRFRTALALSNLGNASEPILQALLRAIQDEESLVRLSAADALRKLGDISEPVLHALLRAIRDEDSTVRWNAAAALGDFGNVSEPVLQALLHTLQDEESLVRGDAASALGKLGKTSDHVTSSVVQWIEQNQDSEFVGSGIDALWAILQE